MKRIIVLLAILSGLLFLTLPCWAQKEQIQLKAVQFINVGNPGEAGFHLLIDMINKAANGELVIKIAGGPEAMPGRQQPEAVRSGAIDMAMVPGSWFKSMVPVNALMHLNLLEPWEGRKLGLYDFLVEEHKKAGLRYIGNAHVHGPFYFYSKEPINSVEELKGKRFRHSPAYPFFPAFGIKPITAAHSEIYPGLERNLFDGLAINHTNFIDLNLYEVCKYIVGPGFYNHGFAAVIMNMAKFNGLPQHLQKAILESMEKAEPMIKDTEKGLMEKDWKTLRDNGMKHIQWTPAENKAFLDKVNEVTLKEGSRKIKPDIVEKMKKMLGY